MQVALRDWDDWGDEVVMVAMPLFHVAGCEWGYLGYTIGGLNVVMPEVDPAQILHDIETYKVTQTLFVPAVILFTTAPRLRYHRFLIYQNIYPAHRLFRCHYWSKPSKRWAVALPSSTDLPKLQARLRILLRKTTLGRSAWRQADQFRGDRSSMNGATHVHPAKWARSFVVQFKT